MADKYYDRAMVEFNQVIKGYEDAGVFTSSEEKSATQQFMGALAQQLDIYVNTTFTEKHPGDTSWQPALDTKFTAAEVAERTKTNATSMVGTTMAEWTRGPNVGIPGEHEQTVDGKMAWVHDNFQNRTGKQVFGPLFEEDGTTPKLGPDGNQLNGDILPKSDINKQWAKDIVKLALNYVQLEKDGKENVEELGTKAAAERQHAKDHSFLTAEAEARNKGGVRAVEATVESMKQEHLNIALTYDKQAVKAIENYKGAADAMAYRYFHPALHISPLDKDNVELHHLIIKEDAEAEKRKSIGEQSSLQGGELTPAQTRSVLQHMAALSPEAAEAFANHLKGQTQQSIQAPAQEVQV